MRKDEFYDGIDRLESAWAGARIQFSPEQRNMWFREVGFIKAGRYYRLVSEAIRQVERPSARLNIAALIVRLNKETPYARQEHGQYVQDECHVCQNGLIAYWLQFVDGSEALQGARYHYIARCHICHGPPQYRSVPGLPRKLRREQIEGGKVLDDDGKEKTHKAIYKGRGYVLILGAGELLPVADKRENDIPF